MSTVERRRPPGSTVAVAVSLASAAALLAACSGDDVASPSTAAPTTATPVDEQPPQTDGPTLSASTSPTSPTTVVSTVPTATEPVPTTAVAEELPDVTAPEGGGESLGPLGETEVDLETGEGTVQIGSGDVPAGAATLPLPDDFEVQLASETTTDLGVTGTTSLSFDEVIALYEVGLPAAGYEITERTGTDGVFVVLEFESPTEAGDVLIATTPGSADLTLTLALADR